MGLYATNNRLGGTQQAISTGYKTQVQLTAATASLRRGCLVDLRVGPAGAPAATDRGINFDVSRTTGTLGTGTTATPVALNPADAASDTVARINMTIETAGITAASSMLMLALNQRASQRWIAAPGEELIWPATDLSGIVIRALAATGAGTVGVHAIHNDL
jgi:hypothetical protein